MWGGFYIRGIGLHTSCDLPCWTIPIFCSGTPLGNLRNLIKGWHHLRCCPSSTRFFVKLVYNLVKEKKGNVNGVNLNQQTEHHRGSIQWHRSNRRILPGCFNTCKCRFNKPTFGKSGDRNWYEHTRIFRHKTWLGLQLGGFTANTAISKRWSIMGLWWVYCILHL